MLSPEALPSSKSSGRTSVSTSQSASRRWAPGNSAPRFPPASAIRPCSILTRRLKSSSEANGFLFRSAKMVLRPAARSESSPRTSPAGWSRPPRWCSPSPMLHADRTEFHAMPLAVLDQRGGGIKSHGLVVQQAGEKFRGAMRLEIRRGVGQVGETDGVRFGKAVKREGAHGVGKFDQSRLSGWPLRAMAARNFFSTRCMRSCER